VSGDRNIAGWTDELLALPLKFILFQVQRAAQLIAQIDGLHQCILVLRDHTGRRGAQGALYGGIAELLLIHWSEADAFPVERSSGGAESSSS